MREVSLGFRTSGARGCLIQQVLKPVTAYGLDLLKTNELPALTGGIDHAVRAIGHLYRWSRNQTRELPVAHAEGQASQIRPSTERDTLAFLDSFGVPVIPQRVVTSRAEAEAAARSFKGPLVLKILSPDIQHKTEVGGVLLNLDGVEAVVAGYDRIMANVRAAKPAARIEGVIVSPMRNGGVELLVGVARDPVWGLALAVGLGGVWVELLGDTQLRLLPVSAAEAKDMLAGLKASKLLTGYRGSKPADLDELAGVIARIGDAALALGNDLDALEINPLRVDGSAVEALDALAIWRTE